MLNEKVNKFSKKIDSLADCCERVEFALDNGLIQKRDAYLVYSSSFLTATCQWESLIEDTLVHCICGDVSQKQKRKRLAQFKNTKAFYKIALKQENGYLSFPKLRDAKLFAKKYISNAGPLSGFTDEQLSTLSHAVLIRNAIAHESGTALRKFRESCPGVSSLAPRSRFPGPYLRHEYRKNPSQTRIENYFTEYKLAAITLSQNW